jgi:hypothetical protein
MMADKVFDPEQVERLVIADEYHMCPAREHDTEPRYVAEENYDALLALYRKAKGFDPFDPHSRIVG